LIEALLLAQQIKIYPNPARDMVYVFAPVPVYVLLTGIEGKIIKHIENGASFAISDLAPGMYLLRITDEQDNLIKIEKLIKTASN